jgi:hypothetical protein
MATSTFGAWVVRHRATVLPTVAFALVVAGQVMEDLADGPRMELADPSVSFRRWTVIAATLYMLVISGLVDRTVVRSLEALKQTVRADQTVYAAHARRMRQPAPSMELALLGVAVAIVLALFVVAGIALPVVDDPVTRQGRRLPDGVAAVVVLSGYAIVGWAGLRLVYVTVRLARALASISRLPLDIDVFDTTNLLPFGNLALVVAAAPAGIIVILLLGLGQPRTPLGISVLALAAAASLLALLLPILGIHREMARAKQRAMSGLNARIRHVYEDVGRDATGEVAVGVLSDRTSTLVDLRKTVQEMTTWPFRDTLAFGRAVLIASAPIIYAALSELIKVLWFR